MRLLAVALALVLGAASPAAANLDFYIFDGGGANARYTTADIVDIQDSRGLTPIPNTHPTYRMVRVITSRTKQSVIEYIDKGSTQRRAYYLDTTKMSAADLAYWNANRVITTTEATALGWISRKPGQ